MQEIKNIEVAFDEEKIVYTDNEALAIIIADKWAMETLDKHTFHIADGEKIIEYTYADIDETEEPVVWSIEYVMTDKDSFIQSALVTS